MYWFNRGLLKNISLRKGFSPYLTCNLETMGVNSKIIGHKKIWTYGEYALMVEEIWRTSKLTVEGYCIFDK